MLKELWPRIWQNKSQMSDPPRTFSLKNKIIITKKHFIILLCYAKQAKFDVCYFLASGSSINHIFFVLTVLLVATKWRSTGKKSEIKYALVCVCVCVCLCLCKSLRERGMCVCVCVYMSFFVCGCVCVWLTSLFIEWAKVIKKFSFANIPESNCLKIFFV